jgi:hypothetical protein
MKVYVLPILDHTAQPQILFVYIIDYIKMEMGCVESSVDGSLVHG